MVEVKKALKRLLFGDEQIYATDFEEGNLDKEKTSVVIRTDIKDDISSIESIDKSRLKLMYRKVDMRVIPALWVLYFLTSYGGAAFGNALTMNMSEGHSVIQYLKMTFHDISLAMTLDTVGFIVFDLPMNLCFTFVAARIWLSRIVITVGFMHACIAAVKSSAGMQVLLFFTGVSGAGVWPGMTYYISMFYPSDMLSARIGYYFTAAQISAAVSGLLGAAFQKMDMVRGLTGYQWNFIIYGVITVAVGFFLIFWLPNRPRGQKMWPLTEEENQMLQQELARQKKNTSKWTWRQFFEVLLDVRIWPLILMYFGVVGTGIGIENYATTILTSINPKWSSIDLSLLMAPIWLFDFGGIILITPFSDRWPQHRVLVFCFSCAIIICGLFVTTFAHDGWSRWAGLLICGFGLGPTVPITMSLGATIFYERHGDIGVAMASALISGIGNTGSVTTTYALYSGWIQDANDQYRDSNMVMVSILGISIFASWGLILLRYLLGDFKGHSLSEVTCFSWLRGRTTVRT